MVTNFSALTSHVDLSGPRYPEKAFCPQGHCIGLQMGANADTACRRHIGIYQHLSVIQNVFLLMESEERGQPRLTGCKSSGDVIFCDNKMFPQRFLKF